MPTVTIALRSQRGRPIPDRIESIAVRGLGSGPLQPDEVNSRPGGEIVLDLVPDHYTIDVRLPGFVPAQARLVVGFDPIAKVLDVENVVTTLPAFSRLTEEQQRLLASLDPQKNGPDIWDSLPDNKAATFFQVTHALTEVSTPDGSPLSTAIDRIVRLGGSQLTAPDATGALRTVIGWRMHVTFVGGQAVDDLLLGAGFKRDTGDAHPTHKRFGFVNSFREKGSNPRLQFVTDYEGLRADVDLDNGVFHKSSPQDIFKNFAKRFPKGAKHFKVKR